MAIRYVVNFQAVSHHPLWRENIAWSVQGR